MVTIIKQQAGKKPKELLADSGYCSEQNLEYLEKSRLVDMWQRIDRSTGSQRKYVSEDRCQRVRLELIE